MEAKRPPDHIYLFEDAGIFDWSDERNNPKDIEYVKAEVAIRPHIEAARFGIGRYDKHEPRTVELYAHVPEQETVYHLWMTREQAQQVALALIELCEPEHVKDETGWLH